MKAWDFFDEVYEGYLSEFDMLNMVEDMTDHFDPVKLNLLCEEFDFYLFMKVEEFLGSFSHEEIENKMHEIQRAGKKIPMLSDRVHNKPIHISDFFERKKTDFKKKSLTDEQKKKREEFLLDFEENKKIILDTEKLFDPHGIEFFSLYRLRNILVDLKIKHTDSIYKFEDIEPHINKIQPIKWLKSDEALRQFIEALKENGLIHSIETEDVIQHFEVSGREAKQVKLEPINWLKSKALLAYLIDMLSKEPEPSAPFMDSIKKWELVKLHFVVKGKKITRSLVSDLKQTMYPNGCTDIDDILKRLPVY